MYNPAFGSAHFETKNAVTDSSENGQAATISIVFAGLALAGLTLLAACNGVDPEASTKPVSATYTIYLPGDGLPPNCVNPIAYVNRDYPERPSLNTRSPIATYAMQGNLQNGYSSAIDFPADGRYTVSIGCSRNGNLEFISHRMHQVRFGSTVGLINFSNQPPRHPMVSTCGGCHTEGGNSSYLVTEVDHSVWASLTPCRNCHDGIFAKRQFSGHLDSGTQDCEICHRNPDYADWMFPAPIAIAPPSAAPEIRLTLAQSVLMNNTACLDNTSQLDAAVYVYSGNPVRPYDINPSQSPPPLRFNFTRVGSDYSVTIPRNLAGIYRVSVVCGVSEDLPETSQALTFLSHRWYRVTIKNTAGLLVLANQPSTHPTVSAVSACAGCHVEGEAKNYLVTSIEHSAVSTDCISCHALPTNHPLVNGQVIPATQNCSDTGCHGTAIWAQAVSASNPNPNPNPNPSTPHANLTETELANCKACHSKPPSHPSTTFQCGHCHDQDAVNWCRFVYAPAEALVSSTNELCTNGTAFPP